MGVLICVVALTILASVVEGIFHQFILHTPQKRLLWGLLQRAFHAHALEHHPKFRADKYQQTPGPEDSKISLEWYFLPTVLLLFSPLTIGAWMLWGFWEALTVVLTTTAYYTAYEFLHWNMHFPKKGERLRWFRRFQPLKCIFEWFDRRHFVHHLADDRNFNVVLPIYDILVGRYSVNITHIPWAIRLRKKRNLRRSQKLREQLGK